MAAAIIRSRGSRGSLRSGARARIDELLDHLVPWCSSGALLAEAAISNTGSAPTQDGEEVGDEQHEHVVVGALTNGAGSAIIPADCGAGNG